MIRYFFQLEMICYRYLSQRQRNNDSASWCIRTLSEFESRRIEKKPDLRSYDFGFFVARTAQGDNALVNWS